MAQKLRLDLAKVHKLKRDEVAKAGTEGTGGTGEVPALPAMETGDVDNADGSDAMVQLSTKHLDN